ncbi:conserved hypothetical protein [Bathymodiolus platifrons methanotrophic gill symbiont]|uniref:antitoxin n=1 Tax=Bathymodiolus platifrons methanotrophic gill symbiont TaxID=113268 RepID=UPI000B417807|nr:antitoxin [Bathymodiolus platifrons methanotrophic gill symbiont]GAW86209.1 conserved hypothetical protein [Bathymodiolus platifrons methanotrophic gill symbiont]GFO77916.1 antitoxin [Bathymodiolus platifrons methanotrophic gill symbiont]
MDTLTYSTEELEILDAIEGNTLKSVPNLNAEIEQVTLSVKNKLNKRKPVNLRLLEADIEGIKTEAIKQGMPYQTLISSILHQYLGNLAK